MAGRKPKPTRIKQLAGNPGKHPLNLREPIAIGRPDCPEHLDAIAREEWDRVAPLLEEMGILGSIDRAALAGYCSAYSVWVRAEAKMGKSGRLVIVGATGALVANPYIRIATQALDQMRKFMVEFGMTPSSRSRIVGTGKRGKEANPFADIANETRAIQ
jgi:P27 family predicted phage terminase small subunit